MASRGKKKPRMAMMQPITRVIRKTRPRVAVDRALRDSSGERGPAEDPDQAGGVERREEIVEQDAPACGDALYLSRGPGLDDVEDAEGDKREGERERREGW